LPNKPLKYDKDVESIRDYVQKGSVKNKNLEKVFNEIV